MTDLIKALRERTGTIGAGLITAENTPLTTSWDAAANPTLVSHGDKAQAKGVGRVDETRDDRRCRRRSCLAPHNVCYLAASNHDAGGATAIHERLQMSARPDGDPGRFS